MTKKKLFLIDAMALIYRAHFAFIKNPRINSKGFNTSAIFGFMNSLLEILEREKPTHIAVAFDSHEAGVRTESFSEYKANRDKQPEDISMSIPLIRNILEAMQIRVIEIPGYEADDIIATITEQVSPDSFEVFMFTPDKDYAQLVKEHVFLYKPGSRGNADEIWNIERVLKEFEIKRVDQVIEIQGLMGDAVDNIPGIPGIGPKTARQLISDFDHIENLLQNTDKLKGKIKEQVGKYGQQAIMSRELARLIKDVPVAFYEEEFKLKNNWQMDVLEAIFADLEFRALGKRLLGKEPDTKASSSEGQLSFDFGENVKTDDIIIENFEETEIKDLNIAKMKEEILRGGRFAIAFAFNHNDPYYAQINAVSVAVSNTEVYTLSFKNDEHRCQLFLGEFKDVLESKELKKYGYDLKFAGIVLRRYGIKLRAQLNDSLIMHYIIDPESSHDYSRICETYLGKRVREEVSLFGSNSADSMGEKAINYLMLGDILMEKIESLGMKALHDAIESPLIEVLIDMEYTGVRINEGALGLMSKELGEELSVLEKEIITLAGISFNVNSPQQLGNVLFERLQLDPKAKKTKKGGQFSTSEDVLQKLAEKHSIAKIVLEYRVMQKLRSTYLEALPQLINKETGMIHTTYDQANTATGRLSSRNPNLQNIPIRTERGRLVREAFIPREHDSIIVSADYSQIELRVVAHMSEDENMIEAFRNNLDIHTATAARVFRVGIEDVTADMRRKAKEVNFGIIYGISSWGLSQRLNIPKNEAAIIIDQYYKSYPGVLAFIQICIDKARQNLYAETLLKRRRYLRDINSRNAMQRAFAERNAINAPVQGSAADIIKIAMINIHEDIKARNLKSVMIMQVHDELVFDVKKDEVEVLTALIKDKMENAIAMKVPLVVELGKGGNWLEAH